MSAHQHSGSVQGSRKQGTVFPRYFAVCATCGWQGFNDRQTLQEAERDMNDHVAATGVEHTFGGSDNEN